MWSGVPLQESRVIVEGGGGGGGGLPPRTCWPLTGPEPNLL